MSAHPEPPHGAPIQTYEGRPLDRPHEEVVDQGLPFDLATLFSRRRVLSLFGIGAGAMVLAACAPAASGSSSTTAPSTGAPNTDSGTEAGAEIPDETAGPYPGDGSNGPDILEDAGVVRSDIRSSIGGGATATGVPMILTLKLVDMASGNVPFANAAVYAWHCDAAGGYSMYSQGIENETYLRGVQVADAAGEVTFTSTFPGCYSGRWPHVHFEVYPSVDDIADSTKAIATSQVALTEEASNAVYARSDYPGSAQNLSRITLASDNVFGDDGGELQLATVSGDATSGYRVQLTVPIDTATVPTGGGMAPGGGPGGGAPGGGGPGGGGPGGAPGG